VNQIITVHLCMISMNNILCFVVTYHTCFKSRRIQGLSMENARIAISRAVEGEHL